MPTSMSAVSNISSRLVFYLHPHPVPGRGPVARLNYPAGELRSLIQQASDVAAVASVT